VVSEGELRRALQASVPADKIVFAGVGKTKAEMATALDAGIFQFNVESVDELEALNEIAVGRGRRAPVALRINPDVEAGTHAKISTGRVEHKFGIDLDSARRIAVRADTLPGIALKGLALHIGSQLTDLAPFRAAFERVVSLFAELHAAGMRLQRLDLGGGLGIIYRDERPPDVKAYASMVREVVNGLDAKIIFEPGRLLVGNAGVLITRVLYVKQGVGRRFVIVDAAMNDLMRPSLYDAYHEIVPVRAPVAGAGTFRVDIVGPICETADTFGSQRPLPPVYPGDLLAICSAGAYGAVMASYYNLRLPAPEVLVCGDDYSVVRPRPDYATVIAQERLPHWFAQSDEMPRSAQSHPQS
jgi:diaminopimelate decarboxylase